MWDTYAFVKMPEQPAVDREQILILLFFEVIFTSLFHADILHCVSFNKRPVCL